MTVHNFLLRHMNICSEVPSATCRLCGQGEESSEHVIYSRPHGKLVEFRLRHWGAPLLKVGDVLGYAHEQWCLLMALILVLLLLDYSIHLGFGADSGDDA